jgi:hypothetical protein
MEALIRKELEWGNDPYQLVRSIKEEFHPDYSIPWTGIPNPQTEDEMNDPENVQCLAEWIAAREEVTTCLQLMGSKLPTKENEVTISPEEEWPMLEDVMYAMTITEPD